MRIAHALAAASGIDAWSIASGGMANSATLLEPTPMLEATTHRCHGRGHREFVLRFDEERTVAADVRRLAESLEEAVAAGTRFLPGDVVHVGWIALRVVETPTHLLSLVEPDFCGLPLRYVPSVDAAVGHLRAQDDLLHRLGLEGCGQRPSVHDTVKVCAHLTSRGLVLDRSQPTAGASGWIAACGEDDELRTVSLYELASRFPQLIDFLALPAGSTVACTDLGEAIVWLEGQEVGVRNGVSFAARLSRVTAPLARGDVIR